VSLGCGFSRVRISRDPELRGNPTSPREEKRGRNRDSSSRRTGYKFCCFWGFGVTKGFIRKFLSVGRGSSLIFVGILEFWLLGGVADSSFSFFRFCGLRLVGLIGFPLEDRLKRITFNGKAMSRSRVLLLRNFLRRSLRLQHSECG
jgi:hypothetical protein